MDDKFSHGMDALSAVAYMCSQRRGEAKFLQARKLKCERGKATLGRQHVPAGIDRVDIAPYEHAAPHDRSLYAGTISANGKMRHAARNMLAARLCCAWSLLLVRDALCASCRTGRVKGFRPKRFGFTEGSNAKNVWRDQPACQATSS